MSAIDDSARGGPVTRNRGEAHASAPDGDPVLPHLVGMALTLLLLAPAAAVLVSRSRSLVDLERRGTGPECQGVDVLGPVLSSGLPVVLLLVALPAALLSLSGRARGWLWLLLALLGSLVLEVALRAWLPTCL